MRIPTGLANASISFECSVEQGQLAAALCKAQLQFTPVKRTLTGIDEFGNEFLYAGLDAMQDVYRKPLASNGICTDCSVVTKGDREALQYKLTHAESGQWKTSCCIIPLEESHTAESKLCFINRMRKPLIGMLLDLSSRDEQEEPMAPTDTEEERSQTYTLAEKSITEAPTLDRLDALSAAIKQRVKDKSLTKAQAKTLDDLIDNRKQELTPQEVTA